MMKLCDDAGVPAGVVNTLDRVMTDPQIVHRKMVIELAEGERRARVIGSPIFFAEAKSPAPRYAPAAGEDSELVLKDIAGFADSEIAALIASGAVKVRRQASS